MVDSSSPSFIERFTVVIVTHESDVTGQTKRIIRVPDGQIVNDQAVLMPSVLP